jgi:hypothetical protein
MAINKFQKPENTASNQTAAAAAAGGGAAASGRYAGLKAAGGNRTPMPVEGSYVFRFVRAVEELGKKSRNYNYQIFLQIVEILAGGVSHKVGDVVKFLQVTSGGGALIGGGKVKAAIMAFAGFTSETEYDAFDPEGKFMEACIGASNSFKADAASMVGRLARGLVTRGSDDGNGDWYREYAWNVVPEEEQPQG